MNIALHLFFIFFVSGELIAFFYWSKIGLYFSKKKILGQFDCSLEVVRELSEDEKNHYYEIFGGIFVSDYVYSMDVCINQLKYKRITRNWDTVHFVRWFLGRVKLNNASQKYFEGFKNVKGCYSFVLMKGLENEDIYAEIISYPSVNSGFCSHLKAIIPVNVDIENKIIDSLGTGIISKRYASEEERKSLSSQMQVFFPQKYMTLSALFGFSSVMSIPIVWLINDLQYFYFPIAMMIIFVFFIRNIQYACIPEMQIISNINGRFLFKKDGLYIGGVKCSLPEHLKNKHVIDKSMNSWIQAEVCRYKSEYMLLSINGCVIHQENVKARKDVIVMLLFSFGITAALILLLFLII
ncbi:hypothetical protein [Vreelandella zhanjiangensis]|uniref:hypothetical protein n=1 Tax=Vreelandella zhanjiangensis TaxID=1121960 RepID=UPI000377EE12|nr:hypothetical protein [Halomonas zhanjiangensis]